jgi:hypothetical protein
MSLSISEDLMMRMWPAGDQKIPGLRAGIAASSARVFAKYGVRPCFSLVAGLG